MKLVLSGGTSGFIISSFSAGSIVIAHGLAIFFLGRSFAETILNDQLYKEVRTHGLNLLEKGEVQSRLARLAERLKNNKQKLKTFNWGKKSRYQKNC